MFEFPLNAMPFYIPVYLLIVFLSASLVVVANSSLHSWLKCYLWNIFWVSDISPWNVCSLFPMNSLLLIKYSNFLPVVSLAHRDHM